jgi:hypothetical protein
MNNFHFIHDVYYISMLQLNECMFFSFHLDFSHISHGPLLLIFGNIYLFHRFQQTLLVLLNIGHTHSGTSIIALHMNMIILLAVVAVSEWRSVPLKYFYIIKY